MRAASHGTFFQRYSILVLMVAVFLLPFGMRGARMAVSGMRNDVKDWLPADFDETTELKWFRDHFSSESFIVATWDGCRGTLNDEYFRLFVDKFIREVPPSRQPVDGAQSDVATELAAVDNDLGMYVRQLPPGSLLESDEFPGNKYGLYLSGADYTNWGGEQEKWLRGNGGQWYYVLPNGDLYQWQGIDSWLGSLGRTARRWVTGGNKLAGERVFTPDARDGVWYYSDPGRLEADIFETMMTGPSVLHALTREGGALAGDREAAVARLKGTLIGVDGQTTCVFATLTAHGRNNLHQVVGRGLLGRPHGKLLRIAEQAGLRAPTKPSLWPPPLDRWFGTTPERPGPEFRMGGPPVDNVAIDEEGQVTLVRLVGLSALLGLIVSWFSFRSVAVTLTLFFVGIASAVAGLGFVWWGGSTMDAVLMSMPTMVYVLAISGGVHIVNYYRDTVATEGFPGNPMGALRLGWKPCTLAAVTEALGLVSLANADIAPICKFGIYSALAVVFMLVLMFTVVPAALQLWPPRNFALPSPDKPKSAWNLHHIVQEMWLSIARFLIRRHVLVVSLCLVVTVVGLLGVRRIKTTVQLLKLFQPESKIITDYTWLETHLGKLVPMELVVRVEPSMIRQSEIFGGDRSEERQAADEAEVAEDRFRLSFLDRMEITEHIRTALDQRFADDPRQVVGQSMMAATFVPPLPKSGRAISQTALRGAYSRQLASYREEIMQSDYFRIDHDNKAELWRISLRLAALTDVDYGEFVNDIKTAVEPVMAAYKYRNFVLNAVDRKRGRDGFRGARVLALGAHRNSADVADKKSDPVDKNTVYDAQWKLFSLVLDDLLTNSAVKVTWHDPSTALQDDWSEKLDRFDCIMLIRPDERYNQVKGRPELTIVDATDFAYDVGKLDGTAAEKNQPVQVVYTGLVPVVYKAQRTLLNNLIQSTLWAFVSIAVVMALLLRSARAGVVSMLPNIFPVILVFGVMGWTDVLVDIGSMMTASVAMGVAVDDTIHFLTWFRRGLDDGLTRNEAILLAFDRCATAMTQTTLIAGLGLSVFALSTFAPTQRFGILMLTLMAAALIGDLIFLPAILAGPFGRIFERRKTKAVA